MEVRSGKIVHKSQGPTSTVVTCPESKEYFKSTGLPNGVHYGGGNVTLFTKSSDIISTIGPQRFNQCIHKKTVTGYAGDGVSALRKDGAASVYTMYTGHHSNAIAAHAVAVVAAQTALPPAFTPSGAALSPNDYAVSGFTKMKPDLTELSIPNFVYELDKTKDLFVLWREYSLRPPALRGGGLPGIAAGRLSTVLAELKKFGLDLTRNVAGANLNKNYGWNPTLGDISSLLGCITGLDKRLKLWEKSLNVLVRKQVRLASDAYSASGQFNYLGDTHNPCQWQANISGEVRGFIRYRPLPIAALVGLDKQIRGFMDMLGVELNPRIIWEEIPFSFILDYFLNVGGFLERFKVDALELPIKLVDFALQYKQTWSCLSSLVLDRNNPSSTPENTCSPCTTIETQFHRVPIFPDEASLAGLGWRMPSLRQWQNLLSLGVVLAK